MNQTLKPVEAPYPENIAAVLESYPRQDGYLLKLFEVFANSERFLKKGVPNLLDRGSPLKLRDRELVILRVCANRGCEYEWGVHVAIFAQHVKLTPEQIANTTAAKLDETLWPEQDLTLLRVVDQLLAAGELHEHYLDALRSIWTIDEQLEIFALCGTYQTISFVANHADLPLEKFAARFPGT